MERVIKIDKEIWRIFTIYNKSMTGVKRKLDLVIPEPAESKVIIRGDFNAKMEEKGEATTDKLEPKNKQKNKRILLEMQRKGDDIKW